MQPRTRSERYALKGKDALEKARLCNRTGGFFRHEHVQNPIAAVEGSPSHLSRQDWMVAGSACEELNFKERERAKILRDEGTETRRARNFSREEHRLYAMQANEQAMVDRARRIQQDPMIGRKNLSGQTGYNMISHSYDRSPAGAVLEHHDQMVRYNGRVRGAHLAVRGKIGFNPILGEQTHRVSLPPPPRPKFGWTDGWYSGEQGRSRSHNRPNERLFGQTDGWASTLSSTRSSRSRFP
mmetsp:Transcript_69177/g.123152  ORF Transcript_69177/g.123152 Transcript_69177/m.123152 type:complete len:240 (-) Transcript_69177:97-816(-)